MQQTSRSLDFLGLRMRHIIIISIQCFIAVQVWDISQTMNRRPLVPATAGHGATQPIVAVCPPQKPCPAQLQATSSPSRQTVQQSNAGHYTNCWWSPYLLPKAEQNWALDLTRLELPMRILTNPPRRLLTLHLLLGALLRNIPGDIVETGVFQGGSSILMLKTLDKYDPAATRKFWAADSFLGLPEGTEKDEVRATMAATCTCLLGETLFKAITGDMRALRWIFERNLRNASIATLDQRLHVLEGWFNETLPSAPIDKIAFLRLDGDLYVSTMDPLEALYDKVSPGGLIYIDDYNSYIGCKRAVDEFRAKRGIKSPLNMQAVPDKYLMQPGSIARWDAVWWIKEPCPAA